MHIQNTSRLQGTQTSSTVSSTATTNTNCETFQTLYKQKVSELWTDFTATGLTSSDQLLKETGGESALKIKRELAKQAEKKDASSANAETETIRKFMPDGSILIITSKNGKIVSQYRKKPHLVTVPDQSPAAINEAIANGTKVKTKQIARQNLFDSLM